MSNFPSTPKVKTTAKSLDNDKCIIEGDKYPLVIGQIVKLISNGDQPRIMILADPGHGKTFTLGRIAEILHNELDILSGDFKPGEQLTQDAADFVNKTRTERQRFFGVPDADSVFPSDEHYTPKNKANRDVIYLTRLTGNVLTYDAHELAKCDNSIRSNHNIRMVSVGGGDTYKFRSEYIKRQVDSLSTNILSDNKGVWEVDKPDAATVNRIEELDEEEKMAKLKEREEEIREKDSGGMDELF